MKIKRDGITYTLSQKTLTAVVSGCDEKKEGKVVLPTEVEHKGQTYAVMEIGDRAFLGCPIQSIVISGSVQSIGDRAFRACGDLTDVFIPQSVTHIGEAAFQCYDIGYGDGYVIETFSHLYDSRDNCNAIIETATNTLVEGSANTKIPSSVTLIGDNAFAGRTSLTHIDIPGTVTSIKSDAFRNCENLVSISFSEGLNEIGSDAFNGCSSLTELVFPNSLTELGINYFYECNSLKTLVIPNSVVSTECIGMESLLQLPQLTYLQLPPNLLIDICSSASNYHYEREDEKDKEVGIRITTEQDALCFSVPMPALCSHLKLNPNCKISVGG